MLSESRIAILISLASVLVAVISLYFSWRRTRKERPLIEHEVIGCKHKVSKDGESTDLMLSFRLHNRGDRGTKLLSIEAYATDFKEEEHCSSFDLSMVEYLDAHNSTEKIRAFFCFSPHFQYREKMPSRFKIYHTTGEYSFECKSEESEDHITRLTPFRRPFH